MAASYSHGIVKNHPFLDGNKRTGFMSAYIFLGVNGWSLEAPEEEAVLETLALAAGETSEEAYAIWLERNSVPAN
jgi:death-on-curing protein